MPSPVLENWNIKVKETNIAIQDKHGVGWGSPGDSVVKNQSVNAGAEGSILDPGRSIPDPGRSHIPQGN